MIPSPNFPSYSNTKASIINNKNRILKTIHHHPFYSSSPIINIENTTTTNIISIGKSLEKTPKSKPNSFKFHQPNNSKIELSSSPGSGYSINNENDASPLNRFKSTSHKQFNHCKLKLQSSPYHHASGSKQQDESSSPYLNCSQSSQSSPSSLLLFNLKYQLTTNSNNTSEDISESNNNLSTLSIKTNPPTTPISSSLTDSSASSPSQFKIPIKSSSNSEPHYVTPASSTTNPSSSVVSSKITSVSNSNGVSTTHSAYSRSSSLTSLGSFDIKSTHSSVQSEYSIDSLNKNGHDTPGAYSDLPDSPGEQYNYNYSINNLNQYYQINTKISNFKQSQLPFHEETSILTIDSNPKSNDITVIDRTVMNNNIVGYLNHQHNDSTCSTDSKQRNTNKTSQNSTLTLNDSSKKIPASNTSKSNGSSAYNSQSNSFLLPSACTDVTKNIIQNNEPECNDDEDLVTYDQEGSIINEDAKSTVSSISNVSSLSFPNEPSADLDFIRKILASRKSSLNNTQSSINTIISSQQQQPIPPHTLKRPWSIAPSSFTPPVKLNNNVECYGDLNCFQPLINQQVNRSLFNTKNENTSEHTYEFDDTDYFINYGDARKIQEKETNDTDEDQNDDRPLSISSVPSEIRLDLSNSTFIDKNNFNRLFSKLNTTVNKNLMKKELKNSEDQIIHDYNHIRVKNNFSDEKSQDFSINNDTIYREQHNNLRNLLEKKYNEEQEDDDQKILNQFIDEVLPIAMAANNNASYNDEENEYENDEKSLNESDSLKYELENYDNSQYCLINNRGEINNECVRTLPKIEEVDEEEIIEEETQKQSKKHSNKHDYLKRLSFSKTISTSSIYSSVNNNSSNLSKCPVIQMNKTARLRQQNIELTKSKNNKNNNKSKLITSVPIKRQATTNLNETKKLSCNIGKINNITCSRFNIDNKSTIHTKNNTNGFNFNLRK